MNAIRLCLWMNCSMLCLELTGPTGRRGRGLSPPPPPSRRRAAAGLSTGHPPGNFPALPSRDTHGTLRGVGSLAAFRCSRAAPAQYALGCPPRHLVRQSGLHHANRSHAAHHGGSPTRPGDPRRGGGLDPGRRAAGSVVAQCPSSMERHHRSRPRPLRATPGAAPPVRAIRLSEPLEIDGRLDEEVYSRRPVLWRPGAAPPERRRARDGADRRLGLLRRRPDIRVRTELGLRRLLRSGWRTRCAATPATCARTKTFGVSFDTFYDRRSGFQFYTNPLGALAEFSIVDEGAPKRRLESGLGRAHRALRRRLDGRDGDPLQVAPLSLRCVEGMGFPGPPVDPPQERVGLPLPRARRGTRRSGARSALLLGHAGRPRSSAGQPEPRDQTLRHLAGHDRSDDDARDLE